MNAILLFLMFFTLLFIGAPIALALGGSSLMYLLFIAHLSTASRCWPCPCL